MSEADRILAMLLQGPVCGTEFRGRFGARIQELRDKGHVINKRPCKFHDWHRTRQFVYELEEIDQIALFVVEP